MEQAVRKQILALADPDYQKFSAALLPNVNNILGVRLPLLRKIAKKIASDDWHAYIADAQSEYFEEIMLQGMVIGYAKADIEEILTYTYAFVKKIDNWSVCDSFCTGLKITKINMKCVWEFLQQYFNSEKEFEVRFGVVMLLSFYIDEEYIDRVLALLDQVKHPGYYVKMAIAWAVSICYIKFPEKTMAYLKNNMLDDFTYNKALQKITESYRVDREAKNIIRSMKRRA